MEILNSFHGELKIVKEMVYDPYNFELKNLKWNTESLEYGACSFELGHKKIQFAFPKLPPQKTGSL